MLLAINIGNTNTAFGAFDGERLHSHLKMPSFPRYESSPGPSLSEDEDGRPSISNLDSHLQVELSRIDRIAICSVVPRLTPVYEKLAALQFTVEALTISSAVKLPFRIHYDDPAEVGADRLANVAGGFTRFKKALIVVDMGTAITFDVVSQNGDFLGGVIAPGPQTAAEGLAQKAARLFEVKVTKPNKVIGKSTVEALRSGLYYGTIGLIDNILEKIFESLDGRPLVVATGGAADAFASESKYISEVIPTLTLEGIRVIADFNK